MSGPIGVDLLEWIALRRVAGGRLIQLPGGRYLNDGRALPDYVTDTLPRLLGAGLLALEPLNLEYGHQRLRLTGAGQARYETLRDGRENDDAG